jgi:Camelysin metallo-endopeptidase.
MSYTYAKKEKKDENRKKIGLILICLLVTLGLVFGSLFAYFSDITTGDTTITTGTLDLVQTPVVITQNGDDVTTIGNNNNLLENFNPGDVAAVSFNVVNEGSKSAWLRSQITFSGQLLADLYIKHKDKPANVGFTDDQIREEVAIEIATNFGLFAGDVSQTDAATATPIPLNNKFVWASDNKSVTWAIETAESVISGDSTKLDYEDDFRANDPAITQVATNATTKNKASVAFTLYFRPSAGNEWQDKSIGLSFGMQALQFRNNPTPNWADAVTLPYGNL